MAVALAGGDEDDVFVRWFWGGGMVVGMEGFDVPDDAIWGFNAL